MELGESEREVEHELSWIVSFQAEQVKCFRYHKSEVGTSETYKNGGGVNSTLEPYRLYM